MTGIELKKALGLSKFPYVYIQKIMGISIPTFVVTIDSRRPFVYLSINRVRKTKTTTIQRVNKISQYNLQMKNYYLTPPVLIDSTNPTVNSNTLVIRRDIGAEYWLHQDLIEQIENKNFEVINL